VLPDLSPVSFRGINGRTLLMGGLVVCALGLLFGGVTLLVMFSGMPIAFSLGFVAIGFMYFFMPASSLDTVTQNVYEEMASITLLSIPLFILKGAAIGKSAAGSPIRPLVGCCASRYTVTGIMLY